MAGFFPSNYCSHLTTSLPEVKGVDVDNYLNSPKTKSPDYYEARIQALEKEVEDQKKQKAEEEQKRKGLEIFCKKQLEQFGSLFPKTE